MIINLLKPFSNKKILLTYVFLIFAGTGLWWYFTDIALMYGNYGPLRTSIDVILSIIMILGFPLFLVGMYYKGLLFGVKENMSVENGLGTLGGIFGTILSGCSCCGLTLASYFGLLPVMNLLPYEGLEIKILGTFGLLWALWDTYKNLETCSMKK